MNEVIVHVDQTGVIHFPNYEEIYNQAVELAEHISQVEVTEENVKHTKKLLATVNKRVNELEDSRKAVKKQLLAPYEAFEKQVKEIVNVVKEADTMVRQQVKLLEEIERGNKRIEISELFLKRIKHYPELVDLFKDNDFVHSKHLNKAVSLAKIEEELVQWLEQQKHAIEIINDFGDSEEIMVEYVKSLDPIIAIRIVRDRKIKQAEIAGRQEVKSAKTVTIEFDEGWFAQVNVFMKMSGIPFLKK